MMAAILNSAIIDSAILHIKNFTYSFWLNLMMAAILNSAILDSETAILESDTLLSSLRFTQKHSHSILTLTQTNSIWLKLIHSDLTWWWQSSEFFHLGLSHLSFSSQTHSHLPRLVPNICSKINFTHSFWLNLMKAAILNCVILDSDTAILDSDTLFSSLRFSQIHSHFTLILTQTNSIWLTLWWQSSWFLPSWILPFWIQPFCSKLWLQLIQSDSKLFILTQLDDGSHLGFSHFPQKNFTHSFWLTLMMTAILNSAILDSAICTKKLHSCILTQLDDGCHFEFCHFGFSHFAQNSDSN